MTSPSRPARIGRLAYLTFGVSLISRIHRRVLEHIKREAEREDVR